MPIRPRLQPALIQRAATVGRTDDAFEREADAVAARVADRASRPEATAPAAPPIAPAPETIQRSPDDDLDGERPGEYLIQPSRLHTTDDPPAVRPGFFARLFSLRLGGRPLPDPVRSEMEGGIGETFDDVRIHTGRDAAGLAREIEARAFTIGQDVVFAEGAYQPETHSGRKLIAHELTHVVQQRGPRPDGAVSQTAPASMQRIDFEIPTSIGDVVNGLLRRFAPEVAPIVEKGPFTWLTEKLGGVFGGVVDAVAALNPGQYVDQLVETFATLVETASEIIGALISGDCQPMMDALNRMKAFIAETAGKAWDKLAEFFRPVGDFFADLWASISSAGSQAIDWIKKFAGDVWTTIEDIGRFIWDKTQPIRDYGLGAWDWVKEKLFGPSDNAAEGDSRGGIIGWFSDKATEAWDWVKEKTRPVWEPVNEAVETVRELIPPAFVADLGDKMTKFADDVETTADDLDQGNSVAENREALAGILPSLDEIIATVRGVIVGAGEFLTRTIGTVSGKVTSFMVKLRGNAIVSALASPLSWLETAIDTLSKWASDTVGTLFGWYLKAFDFLTPFVKRLIEIVQQVISVVTDLILLPKLIFTAAWELIPECIREPIKNFLIEQILSRIPVFSQFAAIGQLWNRLQEAAFQILRSLFVDGDIAKAAWTYFKTLLGLIGLPIRLVTSILAKAAKAYGLILKDPIGFLINLLKAMKEGFVRFFANILKHLLAGVTGWLFGHVSAAGLKPPTEFTLKGVLDFVLQLLDITVERVMARLEKKIGKEKVDRIKTYLSYATGAWEFVSVLLNDGLSGLWRFVQEKLSNLWTLVLDATVGWIVEKIITEATIKILSFLDPSGIMAVINSCIAIYRAIETFVEQLKAMLEIVSRVLDGVVGIATGAIDVAAGYLEDALSRSLPIAIAFCADQIGLGGLSDRIREFVEAVREKVDAAIDWLIDTGIKLGKGFLDLLASGVDLAKAGIAKFKEWWKGRATFKNQAGQEHSVYIEKQGGSAKVMIASTPSTYTDFIKADPAPAATKKGAMDTAALLDAAILEASKNQPAPGVGTGAEEKPSATSTDTYADKIQGLLDTLATQTAKFMSFTATGKSSPPIYGPTTNQFGSSASVVRMTKSIPKGSAPSKSGGPWNILAKRGGNNSSYYVRGHLLNHNIGGPGNKWQNLTPLTQEANNRADDSHLRGFEADVKQAVLHAPTPRAVHFVCVANYGRSARESDAQKFEDPADPQYARLGKADAETVAKIIRAEVHVPLSVDCRARELDATGRPGTEVWSHKVDNDIKTGLDKYTVWDGASTKKDPFKVNTDSDTVIEDLILDVKGLGPKTYERFKAEREARKKIRKKRFFMTEKELTEPPTATEKEAGRRSAMTAATFAKLDATYDLKFMY